MPHDWLALAFFGAALLYASVGHGGASGYLVVMSLANFAPADMRPIALLMNVAVASVAWLNFWRAGHFQARLFWPLVLLAVPCAYLGGLHKLSEASYGLVLGSVLLLSAVWLLMAPGAGEQAQRRLPTAAGLALGAGIGGLAGLTGIGGGVLLSPVLVLGRYMAAKPAGALAAGMIVLNSLAGLLAQRASLAALPAATPLWLVAAFLGGAIGSVLGAYRFSSTWVRRLLAAVLFVAAGKMLV
jgi:uncharacterized protein